VVDVPLAAVKDDIPDTLKVVLPAIVKLFKNACVVLSTFSEFENLFPDVYLYGLPSEYCGLKTGWRL
jgi:hypothetical protein